MLEVPQTGRVIFLRLKTFGPLHPMSENLLWFVQSVFVDWDRSGPFSSFNLPPPGTGREEKSESINSSNYKSINKISNIKHRPRNLRVKKHKKEWMIDQSTLNNRMEFMFSLWAEDVIYDPELQMQSGDVQGARDGMCNQFPLKLHSKLLFLSSKVTRFAAENSESLVICMPSWCLEFPLHLISWKIYGTSSLMFMSVYRLCRRASPASKRPSSRASTK